MKSRKNQGHAFAVVLLSALFFAGCDLIAGLLNPLIGSWHTTIAAGTPATTEDASIKADGTFSVVISQGTATATKSGTWTYDAAAETVTFVITVPSPTETQVFTYAISNDRNTLVLTLVSYTGASAPPSPLTFTRTS